MKKTFCFLFIALIWLSGCQSERPVAAPRADNVLVYFDGGEISKEYLLAHYASLRKERRYRDNPELLTFEDAFNHALNMKMIIALGIEEGLAEHPYIQQRISKYKSDLFLKIMKDELIEIIDRETISEEELLAFYQENKESYQRVPIYALQFFMVAPDQASEIREKLSGSGARADIEEMAALFALKQEEREGGGTRVSRSLARFQPAWRAVVGELTVGKVAGPVNIDDKYYVMLLVNRSELYQYSFEEKRAYIRNDVLFNMYRQQWRDVYAKLKQDFNVNIDREKLAAFYKEMAEKK